jgi:hypothetical protein
MSSYECRGSRETDTSVLTGICLLGDASGVQAGAFRIMQALIGRSAKAPRGPPASVWKRKARGGRGFLLMKRASMRREETQLCEKYQESNCFFLLDRGVLWFYVRYPDPDRRGGKLLR